VASQLPAEVLMGKEVTIQVSPNDPATVTYEVERDGDVIRIKAKPKQED
jgi:regulator of RNase E activity RraA